MNLDKYIELSGMTVPTSREAFVKAQIRRVKTILESKLGYPLDSKAAETNRYKELGKTTSDFVLSVDLDALTEPDEVVGSYRVFNYNDRDELLAIDPAEIIHAVKLVYLMGGDTPNGITIKTFDADEFRVHLSAGNIQKYILPTDNCWWGWWDRCGCEDHSRVQLAIDADWKDFTCLPDDLRYLWADMVTYYVDPQKNLRSQTLGSHSWTKIAVEHPEDSVESIAMLKRYAGPNGSLSRTLTL